MPPALRAIGVTKKFGVFVAVSELNLKIQGTKCVGFLGPNGAGKTTTMKIFTGLLSASSFGPRFSLTTYNATIPEGLAILAVYFVVSALLGLWLFERKEFTS